MIRVYQQHKVVFEGEQPALFDLSWSADSTTLAWVGMPSNWSSNPGSENSLLLTNVPTGETVSVPIQFEGPHHINGPTWVRGDTRLGFASLDKIYWLDTKRSYLPFSVYIQNIGSINIKEVYGVPPLTWSPDGQLAAYITSDGNMKIVDIKGNTTLPIITDSMDHLTPFDLIRVLFMSFSR
jgi:hypothetical protein